MAIDVSTFAYDLPAGTYAAGDVVQLVNTSGPAVVRSGRGAAKLKRVSTFMTSNASTGATYWLVSVKNSDWIDGVDNFAVPMQEATAMDRRSGAIQNGHNCDLTPNSAWQVTAVCIGGGTTTTANSITAEIEVDYPSVSAIVDPASLEGIPASISERFTGITVNAVGTATTAKWDIVNVDFFKAGYEYALEKIELTVAGIANVSGYISISNAAGMGGLTRIIPMSADRQNIRPLIEYASKLVKGPMDIGFKLFAASAGTTNPRLTMDFVKRKV